jgi:hypothetical protein
MRLTFTAALTAATAARTIAGLAAPWGVPGYTSAGRLVLSRGSVRLPADLSTVKLMDYHQDPPQAIGYATSAEDTDAGLFMAFQLGSTPACTLALTEAAERLRDGLSVELVDVDMSSGDTVTGSLVTGVALVPVPAFAPARVTTVAASLHPNPPLEGSTMLENTPTVEAAEGDTATIAVTGPIVQADPAPADPPAADAASQVQVMAAAVAEILAGQSRPAAAPSGLRHTTTAARATSRTEVEAALARVMKGSRRPELEAALLDITNTDVFGTVGQDSYVGQLWDANTFERRFVPLLRNESLTSWKVNGWRWVTKPEVAAYAGDKAAIPSNQPEVEPASTEADRLAGGHDLDRKFRDFGDTEFLNAYLTAMTESYARKSDAAAAAFIAASATVGDPTASGGTVLDAAILAASELESLTDGGSPDYFIVGRTDMVGLAAITEDERLAYLELFGVDLEKFVKSNLAAFQGKVVAGMRNAGTFYELPGSPIRVEALDIAKGGIDEALFGYYATLLHDPNGIVSSVITA